MLSFIIKFISIYFCSIYFLAKISCRPTLVKFNPAQFSLLLLTMTLISTLLQCANSDFTYILPFLVLWGITSIISYEPQKSFVLATISFVTSLGIYAISSFICTLIMYIFFTSINTFPYTLLAIFSATLQCVSIFALCKTKRFRKGMPFLSTYKTLNIATFICMIITMLSILFIDNHDNFIVRRASILIMFFALTFLIYWWQAQITKAYRQRLVERELESLRIENMELLAFNEKILKDNERLSTISHRDNTLISTMVNANTTYLRTSFATEEERIATGERLATNLETLAEGRVNLPSHSSSMSARRFDTGISLLDELLGYMSEEAAKQKILFSVHSSIELSEFVPKDISESELVHVIDDLLKNAFKATRSSERRMVQLQFYKLGKHFVVEVADNGIPFEIRSLVNMGIERLTTYEDGSGIGLMDIWNTKETLRATYHLEEYASASPFSKRISLTFDKKNRYSIRTYRKEAIQKMSKRIDLQIYEKEK